jgi:hypothetical protein
MDHTKQAEPYSGELTTAAAVAERQAEAREIAESIAGTRPAGSPKASRYSPVTVSGSATRESSPVNDFVDFLKQTKRVWLMVVGAIVGLILLVTLAQRGFEWIGKKRERRHEQAVASATPEHLLARCGQPAEDTTRNLYPILMRTMIYQISRNEAYTFEFSRTAEEQSDWVFLSMKDATGKSYETAEEKVSAMSCLNSRK